MAQKASQRSSTVDSQSLPGVRQLFPKMFDASKSDISNSNPPQEEPPQMKLRTPYVPPKKYACEECDARFARPCELKAHATKHTGERPYPCPLCGRQFSTASNVTRHVRSFHAE
ncbi:hypothetical protein BKA62DRAFT_788553 [Auriculariales sp. MPI-PUGE-AT-0066]|nr:hypothetical protein BKA62DRAFT_788553 [Auriculariales sp. MPI-PUGE-AT-0066]